MPSDADWTQLIDYVVDQGYPNELDNPDGAGNALKSCRQLDSLLGGDCDTSEHPRWDSDDTHYGFDEFGFSALPGGFRYTNGSFYRRGTDGGWWSSTEGSSAGAWDRYVGHGGGDVRGDGSSKASGFGLRCVRVID